MFHALPKVLMVNIKQDVDSKYATDILYFNL